MKTRPRKPDGALERRDSRESRRTSAVALELKAAGPMPAMLWQHDADEPIGVWTEMAEDAKGLRVKGQLCLDTARGKEAYALLKMGALNGLSIGFCTVPGTSRYNDDGVRVVTQV